MIAVIACSAPDTSHALKFLRRPGLSTRRHRTPARYGLTNSDRNLNRYPLKAKDQIHFAKFVPHARFDDFPVCCGNRSPPQDLQPNAHLENTFSTGDAEAFVLQVPCQPKPPGNIVGEEAYSSGVSEFHPRQSPQSGFYHRPDTNPGTITSTSRTACVTMLDSTLPVVSRRRPYKSPVQRAARPKPQANEKRPSK